MKLSFVTILASLAMSNVAIANAAEKDSPDYTKDITPILRKYCAGCHNAEDRDGKFSVESFGRYSKRR